MVRKSAEEIAAHFGVSPPAQIKVPAETRPREPGIIIRGNSSRRTMHSAPWGFPLPIRHKVTGELQTLKPVNLVADLTNGMWSSLVQEPRYRCLIPFTHFGEPDGVRGSMTRTWFNVKGEPLYAWAGFCRNTEEWGPVFAGMTMDSNEAVLPLNERMPVLLPPEDYDRWLEGSIRDVIEFQFRPFPADRIEMDQTDELWVQRKPGKLRQTALL
jgi:putative SOS response-associated peptidase YedK